jgi:hypothetical protein
MVSLGKHYQVNAEQIAEALADPTAQELLRSPDPARLAYLGPDGFPRVVPVGFLWDGERIIVCTAVTAPKVKALTARPEVALTIDVMGPPAVALSVRGTATIDVVDGVADEYIAAAAKGMEPDALAGFEQQVKAFYPQMARIAIRPVWARAYDFGTGKLPAFLLELSADASR